MSVNDYNVLHGGAASADETSASALGADHEDRPLLTEGSGGGLRVVLRRWWSRLSSSSTSGGGDDEKQIGTFGSWCLLINSISGPAIVSVPVVVQQAGWVTPLVVVLFMWAVCLLSSLLLVHSMALVPGNSRFQGKVELTTLVKFFFPRWFYYGTLIIFIVSLLSLIIASLIVSAQTLDFALVAMKETCGLEFYPDFRWNCIDTPGHAVTPFGDSYVLSLGMVIILVIVAPLGYLNLNKNIIVQEAAVLTLLSIVILWTVDFFRKGIQGSVPVVTSTQADVLGTIMFNFVMAITVPSWCSEKATNVKVKPSLLVSTSVASVVFFFVGIIGALAFVYKGDNNLLTMLQSHCEGCFILSRISGYFIPAAIFVTSIPVYAIIVRYNLIDNRLCNKYWAFFFSVIFPWLIAVPFYTGSGLTTVINFASLFLQSTINFILPLLIYIRAVHWSKTHGGEPSVDETGNTRSKSVDSDYASVPDSTLAPSPANPSSPSFPPHYTTPTDGTKAKAGTHKDHDDDEQEPSFQALPSWLSKYSVGISYGLIVVIIMLVALVVGVKIYELVRDKA